MIDDARSKHRPQQPVHHVVEAAHRNLTVLHGIHQRFAEVLVPGLLLVEARERGLHRGMRRLPIGDHKAREVPLALEHMIQQVVVFTGPVAVDLVVRAHHRRGMTDTDADLEGEQIALVHGLLAYDRVNHRAAGLLVVHGVVLDVAHDLVALDTGDEVADRRAGEHRVFTGVLEQTAVARIAREVYTAADGLVEPLGAQLAADHVAIEVCHRGIPACGRAEHAGQQRGVAALLRGAAHADRRVRLLQRGNAEPWDAEHLAGAAIVIGRRWGARPQRSPADAVHELDLLGQGQLFDDQIGALIRGQGLVHPWPRAALGLRRRRLCGLCLGGRSVRERQSAA